MGGGLARLDLGSLALPGLRTQRESVLRALEELSTDAAGGGDFRPEEADSLTGLDAVPKVIFSSTLTEPLVWPNARTSARRPAANGRDSRPGTYDP